MTAPFGLGSDQSPVGGVDTDPATGRAGMSDQNALAGVRIARIDPHGVEWP